MSKNIKAERRTCRQQTPTKIIVERHYIGTEKMETVFKRIAEEQMTKKVKEMTGNKFIFYLTNYTYIDILIVDIRRNA